MYIQVDQLKPGIKIDANQASAMTKELRQLLNSRQVTLIKRHANPSELYRSWARLIHEMDVMIGPIFQSLFHDARFYPQAPTRKHVHTLSSVLHMSVGDLYRKHINVPHKNYATVGELVEVIADHMAGSEICHISDRYLLGAFRQFPVKANEWKRLEAHLAILLSAVKQLLPHERPKEIHVYSEVINIAHKSDPRRSLIDEPRKGIKASINRLREAFGIKTDIATYDCTASERQNCLPHDRYLYCAQHNAVYLISAGFTMKSGHTQLNFDRRPIERQIERLNQNPTQTHVVRVTPPNNIPWSKPNTFPMCHF